MAGEQDARAAALVVGPDGVVSGWSESGRLLLGWTAEDTVGRPLTDLLAAPPPPGFPESHDSGPDHTGLVPLRHRDGSTVDAMVSVHPLAGAGGQALGHAVTVQRWERRPVIADLAFEQCPFALGVYDPELRFLWINASSGRVIAHSEEQVLGKKYRDLFPEFDRELFPERDDKPYTDQLSEVARTGKSARLITVFHPLGGNYANAWATSIWPVRDAEGRVLGVANWGFDMSAEYWARQRLLMLNEASRGIGRTLDVIGTAQELARTPVPGFVDLVTVDLFDEVLLGEEPPHSPASDSGEAITLSRAAQHSAKGDTDRSPGPPVPVSHAPGSVAGRCMATGRSTVQLAVEPGEGGEWAFGPGLAADPAHWPPGNPSVDASIAADGLTGRITVPLRARGALLGVVAFSRSDRPESFTADDLILAEELTAKAAVAIDNARRYARERTTALTLQRSLLLQQLPSQEALEVASRYLPAGTGAEVGGDWFDVIPLSGARVALVVGDVVGHGLHASASMGRLRTAVRTLADVDLPPDELLTHLDDLVIHLASDLQPAGHFQPTGEFGATCLYTVYDPVSRRCTLASAGHPLPLVHLPGRHQDPGTRTAGTAARHRWAAVRGHRTRAARGQPARSLHRRTGGEPRARRRRGDRRTAGGPEPFDHLTGGPLRHGDGRHASRTPHRRRRPAARAHSRAGSPACRRLGRRTRPRAGAARQEVRPRAVGGLGPGGDVIRHGTGGQRAGHQRHQIRRAPDPGCG